MMASDLHAFLEKGKKKKKGGMESHCNHLSFAPFSPPFPFTLGSHHKRVNNEFGGV